MIDRDITHPWPGDVVQAIARFKQGDVVEQPPFFYAAVTQYGLWRMPPTDGQLGPDAEVLEHPPESGVPSHGIITTQTCDVFEQRPRPRQPWIQLAPVYRWDALDPGQRRQVERHEIGHLIRLTGPDFAAACWVADLRIEMPVEKSWLVGRNPKDGFADEHDYLRFAEHLAARRLRPAFHNVISEEVVGSLRRDLRDLSGAERNQVCEPVHQLRLFVTGTRLSPQGAQLLVVTTEDPAPKEVRDWFDGWWGRVQAAIAETEVSLLANRYATLDTLSARDYERSVLLDFRYLSPED